MPQEFEVVYNSDLIIRDPDEAATLCVFYDRVYLPFTSSRSSGGVVQSRDVSHSTGGITYYSTDEVKDWQLKYGTLFDEGVLARVPPPPDVDYEFRRLYKKPESWSIDEGFDYYFDYHFGDVLRDDKIIGSGRELTRVRRTRDEEIEIELDYTDVLRSSPHGPNSSVQVTSASLPLLQREKGRYIRADLIRHLNRSDITLPQIYATPRGHVPREALVALEAKATFGYLLPKVRVLAPDQILELRRKTKDTREGFAMHLQKLSKGLEDRAAQGTSVEEVAGFAKNLIETELIPDYREFRRQLESIRAGNWKNFLDVAGKIVEIDAAPWTPKFWGLLLRALGLTLIEPAVEQKERMTNRYQAFKFMGEIESSGSAFVKAR